MNKLIITGHGEYSKGLLSSLKMLSGNLENIISIDFTEKDNEETLIKKYKDAITDEFNYIFVCDLIGGTPYKNAAKIAYNNPKIKVVTGANLGGILDTNFKLTKLSLDEATNNLIEASKKNLSILDLEKKEDIHEDGI